MTKISFIYFDVVGVIVQDFSGNNQRQEMFRHLGVSREREKEFDVDFDKIEILSSRGVDIDSFKLELMAKFDLRFPAQFSFRTYIVERLGYNKSLWPVIERAQSHYPIGLLTDMYPNLLSDIKERGLLPPIEWDVVVDSSVEKYQKTDKELYKIAELRAKVPAEEILFIDNLQINLNPAAERGWQTFLYDPKNSETSSKNLLNQLNRSMT